MSKEKTGNSAELAENLERAIARYEQTLQVYTRHVSPEEWANTENNLGNAYAERLRGERAENLELAIAHYEQALQVYTRENFPAQWAATQNNLATAYTDRIHGERAENLEHAIAHFEQTLAVASEIGDRYGSARARYNLGLLYRDEGELERAKEAFAQAQEAFASIGLQQQVNTVNDARADVEYELGKQYVDEGRWYDALRLFEQSLAVRRQGDDLNARADTIYQIARTHHLLGNLDKARIHYRDAMRLYQRLDNTQGVAACKTALGRLMIQLGFVDDALSELEAANNIYLQIKDERRIAEVKQVLEVAHHIKEGLPV